MQPTNTITLTHDIRCGNGEAAYYVTERAELMHRDGAFAFLLYTDAICDGLHGTDGYYMGGDQSEWTPVTHNTADDRARAIVAEWVADGWTLGPPEPVTDASDDPGAPTDCVVCGSPNAHTLRIGTGLLCDDCT